ncbi:MAG TPA: LutB/LldF family L-lactate oxidation iron-sulfur protein [Candidatus Angelobacter sp.]|jgi:L-lactate dehydrogenase complex protein LldF|nr:LutB/LldF family L-lactate oxidation iron-sulfur protein [Candidatus Angelobacter sp.]
MSTTAQKFLQDAAVKSADLVHREIIRRGMESYEAAHLRGRSRIVDWEAARQRCQAIKREAINHLDRYLLQFEAKVIACGGHVFWAADGPEACAYIKNLAISRKVRTVVKSKSMVTEEIQLAPVLEEAGITVWETDLGEYIVQLRNEPPYHIVTPAMHLNRRQISELFKDKLGEEVQGDDPAELVALARRTLRKPFFSAEMGISGANFLVADAGVIAISTNEGNGRLCTSVPRIHVAVTGIEKIIPRLEDLAVLWPVLATSGTGQGITTYSTLIGGPRRPGEADGPEEFHVVLVDNGRSKLLADPEQREVLHCIRCGACLNICPVFRNVGGHTYGTTYPGPIGSVLTPHLRGREFEHLSYASSLCGACTSVCPVKINLHHHLLHNRRNTAAAGDTKWTERVMFRFWRTAMLHPRIYALGGWLGRSALRMLYGLGMAGAIVDPMRAWNRRRSPVPLPKESFRSRWRKELGKH